MGPLETSNSDPKATLLRAKTADEGWDPLRLVFLVLITHAKTTEEGWDP